MRLIRLWPSRRLLLRGGLFTFVLAILGLTLFVALPPEPRWTIAEGPRDTFFFGDTVLVTIPLRACKGRGPVQLWDTATGQEVGRFLEDAVFLTHGHSKDGRYLVAVSEGDKPDTQRIRWLDVEQQRE